MVAQDASERGCAALSGVCAREVDRGRRDAICYDDAGAASSQSAIGAYDTVSWDSVRLGGSEARFVDA